MRVNMIDILFYAKKQGQQSHIPIVKDKNNYGIDTVEFIEYQNSIISQCIVENNMKLFSLKWAYGEYDDDFANVYLVYADCTREKMAEMIKKTRETISWGGSILSTDVEILLETLEENDISYKEISNSNLIELSFEDGTDLY